MKIGDRIFETTDLMINAAVEYLHMIDTYSMIECVLHGDGMLKAIQENKILPRGQDGTRLEEGPRA